MHSVRQQRSLANSIPPKGAGPCGNQHRQKRSFIDRSSHSKQRVFLVGFPYDKIRQALATAHNPPNRMDPNLFDWTRIGRQVLLSHHASSGLKAGAFCFCCCQEGSWVSCDLVTSKEKLTSIWGRACDLRPRNRFSFFVARFISLPRGSWLRLSMEDLTPLDTPEVFGGLKTWLFEGPKYVGSLWVQGGCHFLRAPLFGCPQIPRQKFNFQRVEWKLPLDTTKLKS